MRLRSVILRANTEDIVRLPMCATALELVTPEVSARRLSAITPAKTQDSATVTTHATAPTLDMLERSVKFRSAIPFAKLDSVHDPTHATALALDSREPSAINSLVRDLVNMEDNV